VVYTPAGQDPMTRKGVLIASYAWEQDSMPTPMLTEHQRISQALQDLAKIHPRRLTRSSPASRATGPWTRMRGASGRCSALRDGRPGV
jgi:monoamine oxidase